MGEQILDWNRVAGHVELLLLETTIFSSIPRMYQDLGPLKVGAQHLRSRLSSIGSPHLHKKNTTQQPHHRQG
jgi:hypothetical protein